MEPLILHSKWSERIVAPITCIVVTAMASWLAVTEREPIVWWVVGLTGAVGLLLTLRAVFAHKFTLELDAEGFTTRSPLRTRRVLWRDIEAIGIHALKGGRWVAWRMIDGAPGRVSDTARCFGGGWDQQHEALYGKGDEELLEIMQRYWSAARA